MTQQQTGEPLLSIVVPAYNEANRLPLTLQKIRDYISLRSFASEIIVVDDGSSDNTAELAEQQAAEEPRLRVIRNPHMGKGAAVRTGMLDGKGRYVLYTDADLSTPIEEVEKLLPWMTKRNYDIVIGSREGKGARRYDEPFYRHFMGRVFNTLVRLVALRQFQDTQCGFKAFTREATQDLFNRVKLYGADAKEVTGAMVTGFDVEVLYLALKHGYKVREVPVDWYYSPGTKVSPIRDSLRLMRDVFQVRVKDIKGEYRS